MTNVENQIGNDRAGIYTTPGLANLQSVCNDSYFQSLYIAAIAEFAGHRGLQSPAFDVRGGVDYDFDFLCLETGYMFKVLAISDLGEYEKYVEYPEDVLVIVDADASDERVDVSHVTTTGELIVSGDLSVQMHDHDDTAIYLYHRLWQYASTADDGSTAWKIMEPMDTEGWLEDNCCHLDDEADEE